MKIYTGIGSRKNVPAEVIALMVALGELLGRSGWTLRSGAADGSDSAFEEGCDLAKGMKEIFLPWKGFNDHTSKLYMGTAEAMALAATLHPTWDELPQSFKKLHSRNCFQILGMTLTLPTEAVICWTPDGCESRRQRSKSTGGTGTAIVLADDRGIPVFNLKNDVSRHKLHNWLADRGIDATALPLQPALAPTQSALF